MKNFEWPRQEPGIKLEANKEIEAMLAKLRFRKMKIIGEAQKLGSEARQIDGLDEETLGLISRETESHEQEANVSFDEASKEIQLY